MQLKCLGRATPLDSLILMISTDTASLLVIASLIFASATCSGLATASISTLSSSHSLQALSFATGRPCIPKRTPTFKVGCV